MVMEERWAAVAMASFYWRFKVADGGDPEEEKLRSRWITLISALAPCKIILPPDDETALLMFWSSIESASSGSSPSF